MAVACLQPLTLYRPRDPQASDLWRLLDQHFDAFQQVYDERFAARYGFWRPVVERSVTAFLKCGDLHEGFARVRCPDCHHEMFVAFSCKQRCTCPSCHQKNVQTTAAFLTARVLALVPHRHYVLALPKMLRPYFRFDRKLLGKLSQCAYESLKEFFQTTLNRKEAMPEVVISVQTFGDLVNFHPHLHCLVTNGAFTLYMSS